MNNEKLKNSVIYLIQMKINSYIGVVDNYPENSMEENAILKQIKYWEQAKAMIELAVYPDESYILDYLEKHEI
jgi:putative AlgH/UPF0301 family transcriptional regulator